MANGLEQKFSLDRTLNHGYQNFFPWKSFAVCIFYFKTRYILYTFSSKTGFFFLSSNHISSVDKCVHKYLQNRLNTKFYIICNKNFIKTFPFHSYLYMCVIALETITNIYIEYEIENLFIFLINNEIISYADTLYIHVDIWIVSSEI